MARSVANGVFNVQHQSRARIFRRWRIANLPPLSQTRTRSHRDCAEGGGSTGTPKTSQKNTVRSRERAVLASTRIAPRWTRPSARTRSAAQGRAAFVTPARVASQRRAARVAKRLARRTLTRLRENPARASGKPRVGVVERAGRRRRKTEDGRRVARATARRERPPRGGRETRARGAARARLPLSVAPSPRRGLRVSRGPRKTKSPSINACLLYTSPSPRDRQKSRMPSSA